MIGLIIWGVVISKLIGVKQEVILEEVYDISYEELLDRQRSGLYLFRSDINRVVEKVESGIIKPREIRDLWMVFSGLDTNLGNIKKLIMPHKSEKYYYKKIDVFRLELLLNSIRLSVDKLLDLIKTLKANKVEWRSELLVTSILEDVKIVREIVDSQSSRVGDKKVADRLNELKKIVDEIDREVLEAEMKEEKKDVKQEERKDFKPFESKQA